MADSGTITIFFYILIGIVLVYFFNRNDEFLAVILLFFYSSCLARYDKIAEGVTDYIYVAYARNIFNMTDESAYEALTYLFLGTATFSIAYIFFNATSKVVPVKRDDPQLLRLFMQKYQTVILVSFIVIFIISVILTGSALASAAEGVSLAYGQSYTYYFGFALSGMILLMFLASRNLKKGKDIMMRVVFVGLIVLAGIYTYDITNRFRFLSWVAGVAIVLTNKYKPVRKAIVFGIGGYFVVLFFSFLGVVRMGKVNFDDDIDVIYTAASKRLASAEDQNMLDGMMMNIQVYPKYLPFSLGMEHIEILLRPIPRSWWPGKPVGGYANKLGLNDNMEGATVGISPSLYGSFFAEGGIIGIFILCILYAYLFTLLVNYSLSYGSDIQFIIKGMMISGTIPLLRGGDLPGIIAFIGMAFWPVIIFLVYYNNFLKKVKHARSIVRNEEDLGSNLFKLQQQLKPESLRV